MLEIPDQQGPGDEQAKQFLSEKADFWIDLMTETFKRPKVVIEAYPSIAKNDGQPLVVTEAHCRHNAGFTAPGQAPID